ncbi:hypothetical protein WMY93_006026 [Mugilogobius chulae]|uniref:ERI1 exoribonuclease 2 n=1 Tax=Mugilogobius chulae TaxID=88201 RepID=A0AAW0PL67_9GOBI
MKLLGARFPRTFRQNEFIVERELGLLRQRSSSSSGSKKLISNQIFAYVIVIDFESTCWKEKNNYGQEIIEFPAVLLNTSTGSVEAEFHSYVQPQEHPTLSGFCTELTGITQAQVEAGVPLHICLSRFNRWLVTQQQQKSLVFPNTQHSTAKAPDTPKLCTFLTWSDWDLGVCLLYECKRKQINKPSVLNSWIDLRSTYRLFYNRKPKGLNGALQDLGIQFEGREHSGLDDARNTAQLAARMMREGCVLRTTRSLERRPNAVFKAPAETNTAAKHKVDVNKAAPAAASSRPSTSKTNANDSSHQASSLPNSPQQNERKIHKHFTNLSSVTVNAPLPSFTSNITGCVPFHPSQAPEAEGGFEELVVENETDVVPMTT